MTLARLRLPPNNLLTTNRTDRKFFVTGLEVKRVPRVGSERGAALVEAAIVVPVVLLLLFGLIDFGVAIGVKQVVVHSASEGARAAIGAQIVTSLDGNGASNQYQSDPQSNAWDRAAAAQALSSSGSVSGSLTKLDGTSAPPSVAKCSNDQTHYCITVQVTATSPINLPLVGIIVPAAQTGIAVVQVK